MPALTPPDLAAPGSDFRHYMDRAVAEAVPDTGFAGPVVVMAVVPGVAGLGGRELLVGGVAEVLVVTGGSDVWFAGGLAYITIGGPKPSADSSDPEGKVVVIDRKTHKIVREFKGPMFTGDPHGIWGTSDGRLYIGHERGSRVTVINLDEPNDPADDEVETTVTCSESDLAFLKKPIDIVIKP